MRGGPGIAITRRVGGAGGGGAAAAAAAEIRVDGAIREGVEGMMWLTGVGGGDGWARRKGLLAVVGGMAEEGLLQRARG